MLLGVMLQEYVRGPICCRDLFCIAVETVVFGASDESKPDCITLLEARGSVLNLSSDKAISNRSKAGDFVPRK